MNKVKRYSPVFLLVSQPIQVQGNIQYFSTVEFHSSLVLDYLCLDYVDILSVWSSLVLGLHLYWAWTRAPAPWP